MAAGAHDFTIEQGATFEPVITYRDPEGVAIDLTDYTARMMAKEKHDSESYINLTTENNGIVLGGVEGTIQLSLSAEATGAIEVDRGVYDLELVTGEKVYRLLRGHILLDREVTR